MSDVKPRIEVLGKEVGAEEARAYADKADDAKREYTESVDAGWVDRYLVRPADIAMAAELKRIADALEKINERDEERKQEEIRRRNKALTDAKATMLCSVMLLGTPEDALEAQENLAKLYAEEAS